MLDQRLVRDNPELMARELGRRGLDVNLSGLQLIAKQQRDLEEQRSALQAEGNRVGKEVGQRIKAGADPKGSEVAELRSQLEASQAARTDLVAQAEHLIHELGKSREEVQKLKG